jgi:hypothetical protein
LALPSAAQTPSARPRPTHADVEGEGVVEAATASGMADRVASALGVARANITGTEAATASAPASSQRDGCLISPPTITPQDFRDNCRPVPRAIQADLPDMA